MALLTAGSGLGMPAPFQQSGRQAPPEAKSYYGGLRVGLQSWCYRKFPLDQVIRKTTDLGLKYLELSPAHVNLEKLTTAELRDVRRRILDAGLSIPTAGVVSIHTRRAAELALRRAQEMGLRTLLIDPNSELLKGLDRLAARYGLELAIHNSYGTSEAARFASPEAILEALRGCSPRIGAALDTGNAQASGHDAVAALEKLKGRLLAVHLKDIVRPGLTCALGQGRVNIPAILQALRAQQYSGIVAIEYEENPENPDADITASLEYLKKLSRSV